EHGARAAHAVLAAQVGAGEAQVVAQGVGQGATHLDVHPAVLAVHPQRHVRLEAGLDAHADPPARAAAVASTRAARTPATLRRYDAEACRSSCGSRRAAAARPTSANSSASGVRPRAAAPASTSSTGVL